MPTGVALLNCREQDLIEIVRSVITWLHSEADIGRLSDRSRAARFLAQAKDVERKLHEAVHE